MQIINHIEIRDGKAYIIGRGHLKAEMVARMVVDGGYSIEETMEHYSLSAAELYATLSYYDDNQEELDNAHQKRGKDIQENALNSTEHLEQLRSRKSE